ncbi:MAG TPA: NAD(P)H-dependent glycerol-3-phosphate dehydrogenase [Magnetovibrio sp.]
MQSIGIIGAGAFGTAMATAARRAGRDVTVWAFEAEVAHDINTNHINATYLKDAPLDPAIRATTDLAEVCAADAVLVAVPSQHLGRVISDAAAHWRPNVPAMTCSKGVERTTCRLMAEVVKDCLGQDALVATMGGPTFAIELARNLPSAATIACPDSNVAEQLAEALASKHFRAYTTHDIVGAQLGGAVKNVLAIACGIVHGKGLGDNARAALITRGLAEMIRLGLVLGAEPRTLMGMAGLGDVTLTCNAMQSRNFSLGFELGQGRTIDDILKSRKTVAEGYFNAETVTELARRNQVDMPICLAVEAVLAVNADLDAIIHGLLSRPLVNE